MELLEGIYSAFAPLFGENMSEHLKGWNAADEAYTGANLCVAYLVIALATAVTFCVIYYYIVDHPRGNRCRHWVGVLVLLGTANFIFGLASTLFDLFKGNISGDIVSGIPKLAFPLVGVVNAFIAAVFFILFSVLFKWGSRNCKHSPF